MDILEVLAKMDERLARQDEILAKMDERLARQDDTLRQMDTTLRQMDVHLDRLVELLVSCHHEAAAAHQASAVAMSRLAEQTLILERMLRQMERQGR